MTRNYPLLILMFLFAVVPASAGLCAPEGLQPDERSQVRPHPAASPRFVL